MANQTYFCILTAIGEAKDANAKALGTALKFTEMAVGDGNGALPTPDRNRTSLVRQVRRAPINTLKPDPLNPGQLIAEQIIPEDVGGWWIRELGLYDDAGDLIAIGNCPETYKPQLAEGSGRVQVVRMVLIMSSAATVQLKVDPAVVLATRKYADDLAAQARQFATDQDALHVAAVDPHPQYLTEAEGAARIQAAVQALVNSSPAALDTLAELAAALNNDKDFAATMANALAQKAPLADPSFTGKVTNSGPICSTLGSGGIALSGYTLPDLGYVGYNYTNVNGTEAVNTPSRSSWRIGFSNGVTDNMTFGRRAPNAAANAWTEFGRFDDTGNFLVGVTNGASHIISKGTTLGTTILDVAYSTSFYVGDGYGYNTMACIFRTMRNLTTGRSINAAGTINASGADYAEYMTKADNCGMIVSGQIVGIDQDGKLTDKYADAVSFLVKSTNPSYVGGDTWGTEEAIGMACPIEPVFEEPIYTGPETLEEIQAARHQFDTVTMPAYRAQRAVFEAKLEAARQKVDRMAYCGQVPVNVTGAKPGQYVVPVQDGDGIDGQLVDADAITFDQYRRAVGIVQNVLEDGRANLRVKPV